MTQVTSPNPEVTAGDAATFPLQDGGGVRGCAEQLRSTGGFFPSPEQVLREINCVYKNELSPELTYWVEAYSQVGRRNSYLWKWCRRAVELTTLPCVAAEFREEICDTKTLGVMLDVLLDDVADHCGSDEFLEALLRLPAGDPLPDLSRFTLQEQTYAWFAAEVWQEIMRRVSQYPDFARYRDLLRFDYLQLCNVMRYSHLLNARLDMLNMSEHDLYTPHNMHIMICGTIDLMASPHFDPCELGRLREATWRAQCMGRIGNLITTWQRELGEKDFTSGVYARAVAYGDLTVAQLQAGDAATITAAIQEKGHEAYFLDRWQKHRRYLLSPACELHSFNVKQYVAGLERLICLHLGSRGAK